MNMHADPPRQRIALMLTLVAALAACGKKEAGPVSVPAPVPAPQPAPAPAPAPVAAARAASVVIGNAIDANGKIAATDTFGSKDTIYATASVVTIVPNLALGMRWKYRDGQTLADDARTAASPGIHSIEDTLTKATPWPAGDYTLEITLDGQAVARVPFRVVQGD